MSDAASELALGMALIDMIAAEADIADVDRDDKQTRSLMVGGVAVTAILRAARDMGLNKVSMVEGIGIALGLIQAGQAGGPHASVVGDALESGFATGLEEGAQPEPVRPILRVIDGGGR